MITSIVQYSRVDINVGDRRHSGEYRILLLQT